VDVRAMLLPAQFNRARKFSRYLLQGRVDHFAYALWVRRKHLDFCRVSLAELGLSETRSVHHAASGGVFLSDVLRTMDIPPGSRVIDLGCGKASAMCTLARFPFEEVAGVELSPAMARIAELNLRKLNISTGRVYVADASEFSDFDRFTHIYMFNPFHQVVMSDVMRNIGASLALRPRHLTMIYFFPTCHDVIMSSGLFFLERQIDTGATHPYYIYRHELA
jgi:tRNA1(Val) A37 N6-methylase TrmN6